MPAAPHDYGRLFRNLAHIMALSQEEKVAGVVDNLVVTAVSIYPSDRVTRTSQIVEMIDTYFGLRFAETDIESALGRILERGRLVRARDGAIVPSPTAFAEISERVQRATELERVVREEWLASINEYQATRDPEQDKELWECVRSYMAQAFRRHGAETTLLLNPSASLSADLDRSLVSYRREAYDSCCVKVSESLAAHALRIFFAESTPERSRYIAQLLDGTFSFYAVCVDETTSSYLKTAIKPVSIFLDTNFMFGVLRLHDNPLNQVSEELVEAIQRHQFPFKLYYHERTLEEFQAALGRIRNRIVGPRWTQSLSKAALRTRELTIIEQRYHEANARALTDARVFLTKYEHIEQILREKGFTVYREPDRSESEKQSAENEHTLLIHKYNTFLVDRIGLDRAKTYRTIEHDMTVWQSVKRQRRSGGSVLQIGALFLTADHNLFAFDWQRLRSPNTPGHVILPNQLLQLLRPFLVVSTEFDKKFAATFAIPEFRTAGTDYGPTISKVLSYLATFADVSEETATRILANEVLLGRLRELKPDTHEFKEVVDSALIKDNKSLLQENERLLQKVKSSETEQRKVAGTLQSKEQLVERHETLLREQAELLKRQQQELTAASNQLATEREQRESKELRASQLEEELSSARESLRTERGRRESAEGSIRRAFGAVRLGIGVVFWVLTTVGVLIADSYLPWLAHHPKRIGVTICFLLISIGISWAIVDKKRRWLALTAVAIAAVVSLTQIVDVDAKLATPSQSPTPTTVP